MKQFSSFSSVLTLLFAAFFLTFTSCGKDDDDVVCDNCPGNDMIYPDSLAGELKVAFVHSIDQTPLVLSTQQYQNPASQTYNITKLKYYISNVKLINSQTGKTFSEPNSYHLIDPSVQKTTFNFKGVPVKGYDRIQFSVGVDSVQNSRTDQKGDLDPNNEMAWDWKTGYKFFIMEGFSGSQGLVFHVGNNANFKTLTFPLNQTISFQKAKPITATVAV